MAEIIYRERRSKWRQYLERCIEHPLEWQKTEPFAVEHSAKQYASNIRCNYKRILTSQGILKKPLPMKGGSFETRWGHELDQYGIMQTYVWCRYVPKGKSDTGARRTRRTQ